MKSTILTERLTELNDKLVGDVNWINWGTKPTISQVATMTRNLEESEKIELTEKQIKRFEANTAKTILFNSKDIIIYKIGTKICMHVLNVYQRLL
jgi:hypothetical protein